MITVAEAEHIILQQVADYGTEPLHFQQALGRVLAQDILADRDMPASNRATMDGIAIQYTAFENGIRSFAVKAIQAAGDEPIDIDNETQCIEIMTGASLPASVDTVIRYEDVQIENGIATIQDIKINQGQNIHKKGSDKAAQEIVVPANTVVTSDIISAAAFTGYKILQVKKALRVVVFSNGDELMDVTDTPPEYKIRRTNTYTIQAALQQHHLKADIIHLPDNEAQITKELQRCFGLYDVIIACGGVSMGKYDFVAKTLESMQVKKLFHKVQQRPGKPFWFGTHSNGVRVFAFPGNPVSAFMCLHRYFIPWYKACMGLKTEALYAVLDADISFTPQLQFFLQVQLHLNTSAQLIATPVKGNGSGDLVNLTGANAFMELPMEQDNFKKGEVFRVWPFKPLF